MVSGKTFATAEASDELTGQIDRVQCETGEGPCLDAAREFKTVRCDDLRAETRWPRFQPQRLPPRSGAMPACANRRLLWECHRSVRSAPARRRSGASYVFVCRFIGDEPAEPLRHRLRAANDGAHRAGIVGGAPQH